MPFQGQCMLVRPAYLTLTALHFLRLIRQAQLLVHGEAQGLCPKEIC